MAKRHPGMLAKRMNGNFKPVHAFKRSAIESERKKIEQKIKKDKSKSKNKHNFYHQKKNVKVAEFQKDELNAVKKINHLNFDYEAIQFLIDNYLHNASPSINKHFNDYTE